VGPFEEHLRDAIRINQERASLYSRLTGGASESISKWLLLSERCSLPFCKIPDRWAKPFLDAGIPIVKEEFMSMSGISNFQDRFPFEPASLSQFQSKRGNQISTSLLRAYRRSGFSGASVAAQDELNRLGEDRTFHSMLRHILESVIRVSNLAPLHEERRRKLFLADSTLPLSKWLFFSHFGAFSFATWIDGIAAPLQAKGIPILFQDVPGIPPTSSFYQEDEGLRSQ
jgi:hypothetical protein